MKPIKLSFLLVITIATIMASCHSRGEYICVCAGGFSGSYYQEREVPGKSKKDARDKCAAYGDAAGTPDGITCALKQ